MHTPNALNGGGNPMCWPGVGLDAPLGRGEPLIRLTAVPYTRQFVASARIRSPKCLAIPVAHAMLTECPKDSV